MGISLQRELEPLLTQLGQAADTAFKGQLRYDPTNPGQVRAAQQALKTFNNDLSTLMTRFRGYYSLDGQELDPLVDQFAGPSDRWETPTGNSAYCAMAQAAVDVNEVKELISLGNWSSDVSDSFYQNFLDPFQKTAVIHGMCALEMAIATKTLADGVEQVKECVVWICKDLIKLLGGDTAPGSPPGTEKGEEKSTAKEGAALLAILSDTVAFFKTLADPEGEALDLVLAAVGVSGGLIAESKSSQSSLFTHNNKALDSPFTTDGSSASSLVHDAWLSLDQLDSNITDLDEQIDRGLEADLGSSGLFGDSFARISNPHLSPQNFSQPAAGQSKPGQKTALDPIVVNTVKVYYAGYRILPAAADWYDYGSKICTGAHIDGIQKQFPRSVNKFNVAAQTLRGLLIAGRDALADSAHAMVKAAKTYSEADQSEADQIKMLESQIPAPGNDFGTERYAPPTWLQP